MKLQVVAGTLGGRQFKSPHTHRTHPMSERVRGALFNVLGDVSELFVLDAFSGSGALSFEAISRGASRAIAVEVDKTAHRTLSENVIDLSLADKVKAIRANVSSWSDNNPDEQFDLVLCDPPYDAINVATLQKLTRHVRVNGIFVLSWPGKTAVPELHGLQLIGDAPKNYGDATLAFYRKTG
jgi:16S rRNA (guanine(966)-N(2))-methyltransferase RsmD